MGVIGWDSPEQKQAYHDAMASLRDTSSTIDERLKREGSKAVLSDVLDGFDLLLRLLATLGVGSRVRALGAVIEKILLAIREEIE